jgi:DeoR family transcriptional regulator of aga operon
MHMRTGQRRREILRHLFLTGYVEVKEFALTLGVDSSTIRRDFEALARAGHLQRTHGGARVLPGAVDVPYVVKEHRRMAAKDAIAGMACELVRDGDSVLLDSGSTTHQLAVALRVRRDLTIITNDLLIGQLVADYPQVRLLVTGGELLSSTYTICGDRAVGLIEDLRVDWTFLGADAIDLEAGITNTNTLEIPLKRAMVAAARSTVVLADSTKFGWHALVRVVELHEIDLIITDDEISAADASKYGDVLRQAHVTANPTELATLATVGNERL